VYHIIDSEEVFIAFCFIFNTDTRLGSQTQKMKLVLTLILNHLQIKYKCSAINSTFSVSHFLSVNVFQVCGHVK
jgi:hypothetical protein